MGLEGLDASLLNRFWLTGDLGSVGNDYATVLQEAGAQAQGVEVEGEQAQWTSSDTGLTQLSREGGGSRYHGVLGRAQALGRRADDAAVDQAGRTAGDLGLDFDRLTDDLAKIYWQRQQLVPNEEGRNDVLAKAKGVLTALLSSEEIRMRALEHRELSRTGVLALLNAGLGCLKLIADGQATNDSIFELVRGDVYDITKPADVLKLTVKMAQKARETFIDAAQVNNLLKAATARIKDNKAFPPEMKAELTKRLEDAAKRVIDEREKLCKSLDVSFSLGDGSQKALESQLKDVRERLRAFRYDLDRLEGTKMDFMERQRRRLDNIGRSQPTLTRASFKDAEEAEKFFNFLVRREYLDIRSTEQVKIPQLDAVLDRAHLDATTHITHLANNRVRYYFSGKEQKIEAFRQKAHDVLDSLVEKGGKRILQFEVGADAKFRANVGFAEADCKVGANYQYTTEVSVDSHTHEVTVTVTHGGQVAGEATAKLGKNDGDLAKDWDDDARSASKVFGGSAGAKASAGLSREHKVKYRSIDDFIASLGGESSLVTRTPYSTMACLGKICGFFKMLGRGVMAGLTATGFRISKSREDNAAYVAEMHQMKLMGTLDTLVAHRENAIRTQNGTAWNAGGSASVNGSFNIGNFDGTENVENPDTGVEEERVKKDVFFEAGASLGVSYNRTFARTATDYRTHLDTARTHSEEWLQKHVGGWYGALHPADGETREQTALRAIETELQKAEDAFARLGGKATHEQWKAFAEKMGVLALQLAYVEKRADAALDTTAFADRLINPRVSIPDDIYDELMQDVSNVSHTGTHQTTVEFSVNWSAGVGDWLDDASKTAGEKTAGFAGEHGISGTANDILKDGASDVVSHGIGDAIGTLVPTECTVKGSYTYTTPADKTSVCSWSNGSSHTWSIALSPGLTTRALIEFLAVKYADVHADEGLSTKESVKKVGKEAFADWVSAIQESIGIASLENVWDKSMGELAKVSPKIAALLNAPMTGADTGLEASVDTDYSKRMTFTVVGGRLAEISVDDYTKVGSQIGVRVGNPNVSVGVHMKETLTMIDVDRAVLVRPSVTALMGKAEAFLRQGDRAGFTGLLAHNAPGSLRLWRTVSGNLGATPSQSLVDDRTAAMENLNEALTILRHIPARVDDETADRAQELQYRLLNAYETLKGIPDDDEHRAQQIDALSDFVWTLTESFTFARELGGFSRNAAGELVLPDRIAPRAPSWASRVDLSEAAIARRALGLEASRPVSLRENAGGGSCFFYSAIQQVNNPNYPDTVEGANRMRQDFIAHSRQLLADLGTDHAPQGLRRQEDSYVVDTGRGQEIVTDGVDLVWHPNFRAYASNADVSHGAFLADFLKRPVKIITAEHGTAVTFDRNLRTNEPLTGDPIVIYYNRGQSGLAGHFRTVEVQLRP